MGQNRKRILQDFFFQKINRNVTNNSLIYFFDNNYCTNLSLLCGKIPRLDLGPSSRIRNILGALTLTPLIGTPGWSPLVIQVKHSWWRWVTSWWFISHISHPPVPLSWDVVRVVVPHFVGGPVMWDPPSVSSQSVIVVFKVPVSVFVFANKSTASEFAHSGTVC